MGDVTGGVECSVCPEVEAALTGSPHDLLDKERQRTQVIETLAVAPENDAIDMHVPPGISPPVAGATLDDVLDAVREVKAELASLRADLEDGIEVVEVPVRATGEELVLYDEEECWSEEEIRDRLKEARRIVAASRDPQDQRRKRKGEMR